MNSHVPERQNSTGVTDDVPSVISERLHQEYKDNRPNRTALNSELTSGQNSTANKTHGVSNVLLSKDNVNNVYKALIRPLSDESANPYSSVRDVDDTYPHYSNIYRPSNILIDLDKTSADKGIYYFLLSHEFFFFFLNTVFNF